MLAIVIMLMSSWVWSSSQQMIFIGFSIFLGTLFIASGSFHSLWVFVDFMSMILILLTLYLLIFMKLMSSGQKLLSFLMIFLSLNLILVFSVENLLLFYILFEFSLIPMSLMILGWGFQPERLSATLYMIFYTVSASFPFFALIFFFDIPNFNSLTNFFIDSPLITILIIFPFLVKLPIFMVHLWLPKAHVEAPSFGSMILAGILLKLGSFGLWRMYPLLSSFSLVMASFSLMGAAICSLFVNTQTDVKAMIAYSSVVHMGLISFCLLMGTPLAMLASLAMMVAHGICSSGLFCLITLSYERMTSRSILIAQGLLSFVPSLCMFFSFLLLMNLSAPPSLNLLSEVLMMYSALSWNFIFIFWTGTLILFSLIYTLVLFYSFYHGPISFYFSAPTESKKEIFLSLFHSKWWVISPIIFYLFELY